MNGDPRAVLRDAVAGVPSPPTGAAAAIRRGTRLRWQHRAASALSAALAVGMIAALLSASAPDDDAQIVPAGPAPRVTEPAPIEHPTTTGAGRAAEGGETPPNGPAVVKAPVAPNGPSPAADEGRRCRPPVRDAVGDIAGGSRSYDTVDIVSTTFAFDRQAGALRFEHRMRDISTAETSQRATWFDVSFEWDHITYFVDVWIEGGVEHFSVQRRSRAPGSSDSTVVTQAEGNIDEASDTIDVSFTLRAFNAGEQVLSASEGKAPPQELRADSTIDLEYLTTLGQLLTSPTASTQESDSLPLSCSFKLLD